MSKERDRLDFERLLRELESKGRRYGEGDELTEALGGEKFSFATRRMVSEMVDVIGDNPEFAGEVPERLRGFFEGYRIVWPRSARGGYVMDRKMVANELVAVAKALMAIDFKTQDAMDKYLKDHPDADKSRHKVVKDPVKETPDEVEERLKKKQGPAYRTQEQRIQDAKEFWDKKSQKSAGYAVDAMNEEDKANLQKAQAYDDLGSGLDKVLTELEREAARMVGLEKMWKWDVHTARVLGEIVRELGEMTAKVDELRVESNNR